MPRFFYEAIDKSGEKKTGSIEAGSRNQAFDLLTRQHLHPLRLCETGGGATPPSHSSAPPKTSPGPTPTPEPIPTSENLALSKAEILQFTEELEDLLDSGMQLEPALRALEKRRVNSALSPLAARTRHLISEGVTLSATLRRISDRFGDLYINMIQAGEQSGALTKILARLQIQLRLLDDLRGRVRAALVYPAIMIFAATILIIIFMTFLAPQLQSLFSAGRARMPWVTQVMIGASHFLAAYWWLITLSFAAAILGFRQTIKTPAGRTWWDAAQLRIPLVGRVVLAGFLAQLSETLATLLHNGIPLLGALKLSRDATVNTHLRSGLDQTIESVSDGALLSEAMQRSGVFPGELVDLTSLGERTGDLGKSLAKAALRYDKELNKSVNALTSLIQPAIIIVMAVMVGLIAFSMMSGIFQAVNALRPH
ncbi:MAG: type II secretion system F family protein [Verrucomicrobiae bacterium]|nr:type II secretion system F family protein [Verrucomicrobiae bacterium]